MTAALRGAPAAPTPLAPEVGVTGFEIGVLGFSSIFFADGVDALLDVPDLKLNKQMRLIMGWLQKPNLYYVRIFN